MADHKYGTVVVQLPPQIEITEKAGNMTVTEVQQIPKAGHGIGLVTEQTANALEKNPALKQKVSEIDLDQLREAGERAELIDEVINDLMVVLHRLKQQNLLYDGEAFEMIRQIYAQVQALAKFQPDIREQFQFLFDYFSKGRRGPKTKKENPT